MSRVVVVLICFIAVVGPLAGCAWADVTLAVDGRTAYTIVLREGATEVEATAARELKHYLEAVTGADFPLVQSNEPVKGPKVRVGTLAEIQSDPMTGPAGNRAKHVIRIAKSGDDLILGGGSPRATLHAVYTFLEKAIGVRWWTATDEFIPHRRTLTLTDADVNLTYTPAVQHRDLGQKTLTPAFAAKLRLNGHFSRIPASHGGHDRVIGWCHTFAQLLPPKEYFEKHPEWYGLVDGRRLPDAQLCLTNTAMRQELTRRALDWIARQPDAGIISISQNDHGKPCECKSCGEIRDREGSESGPLLHFVNQVAADIAKTYPDIWVETLAYTYTRQPPRHVRPASNVLIRLCPIEALRDRPIYDPVNAPFTQLLKSWTEIAPNLFIWDYTTNFSGYVGPHPNLDDLGNNIRYYVQNNAVGLFMQGNGVSPVGSFEELRTWVLGHLLWDPSLDDQALIGEFLKGYYKDASRPLAEYLHLVHGAAKTKRVHINCYNGDYGYMGLEEMNRATQLFNEAEQAVAGDAQVLERVRRARLELDHLWLLNYWILADEAQRTGTEFLGPADPMAACEAFLQTCSALNAKFSEWDDGRYGAFLRQVVAERPKAALPEALSKAKDYCDLQDRQFRKLFNSRTEIVDDAFASDGKALAMSGDITGWVTRLPLSDVALRYQSPVRCYISVRVKTRDAAAGRTTSLKVGIYDEGTRRGLLEMPVRLDNAGAEYQLVDLGKVTLSPGSYLWVTGPGRPGQVETIYVDRVLFVREP